MTIVLKPPPKLNDSQIRDHFLEPFAVIRGVQKVMIRGVASSDGNSMTKLMQSPFSIWREVWNSIDQFQKRGDDAYEAGDYESAMLSYNLGIGHYNDTYHLLVGDSNLLSQMIWINRCTDLTGYLAMGFCRAAHNLVVSSSMEKTLRPVSDCLTFLEGAIITGIWPSFILASSTTQEPRPISVAVSRTMIEETMKRPTAVPMRPSNTLN